MSVSTGKQFFMSVCDGYFAACNRVIVWCDVVLFLEQVVNFPFFLSVECKIWAENLLTAVIPEQ